MTQMIRRVLTHHKFLVELVGEQRVGQLPEIQLTERAHTVDVL